MIMIKIADLVIGIDNRYEHLQILAKDYLVDAKPLFTVFVSEEEIDSERAAAGTNYSRGYYESAVAYRKIAGKLYEYDAFLLHGCVIEYDGKAYVITAKSGVGKTTHSRLWLSEFPTDAKILNGDKPIIRIIDGVVYACGTPWQGKENYGRNAICPLAGIAFLERAEENRAHRITPPEAVNRFIYQMYLPKDSRIATAKTLVLANKVISSTRLVLLGCNMDPTAAHVCRRALLSDE